MFSQSIDGAVVVVVLILFLSILVCLFSPILQNISAMPNLPYSSAELLYTVFQ